MSELKQLTEMQERLANYIHEFGEYSPEVREVRNEMKDFKESIINDTLNVFSECGLTPRQLLEYSKELNEQIKFCAKERDEYKSTWQSTLTGFNQLLSQRNELLDALESSLESLKHYASHRKDKGTATAKINAWNNLGFHIDKMSKTITNTKEQTA